MKIQLTIVIAVAVLAAVVHCKPAGPSDDVELIDVVPLEKRNQSGFPFPFGDYDDDDDDGGFFPFSLGPFNIDFHSWLNNFEDLITRMSNGLHKLWDGAEFGPDNGNTTSTVQVIDNHKVTINDTVYSKDTPYGTQFVKVRTVHVKPLEADNETEIATPTGTNTRDTELDESNDESNQVLNNKSSSTPTVSDGSEVTKSEKLKTSA